MSIFFDPQQPWKALLNLLNEFGQADVVPEGQLFQPMHVFEVAPWLEFPELPNYNLGKESQHANRVFIWGAYGDNQRPLTETGYLLDQNYYRFVRKVISELAKEILPQLPDPADKKAIEGAETEIVSLNNQVRTFKDQIERDWKDYNTTHPDEPLPWIRYYETHPLKGIINNKNELIDQQYEYLMLLTADKLGGKLYLINEIFDGIKNQFSKFMFPEIPVHEHTQINWIDGYRQFLPANYKAFLEGDEGINYERVLERTTSTSSTIESSWSGSTGIRIGWFRIGGSAGGSSIVKETQDTADKIRIKFKYFKVGIQRGNKWFNTAIFKEYYKYGKEFFTPTGLLSTIPMSTILIKDIEIELISTDSNTKNIEKTFRSGGGIGIGPFNFVPIKIGGSYNRKEVVAEMERNGNSLTIKTSPEAKRAYILGHNVLSPSIFAEDRIFENLLAERAKFRTSEKFAEIFQGK